MASRIIGIDLGAYSVKVAVAVPGFRSASISDFIERPVPPGDEPHLQRATEVLADIIREYELSEDTHHVAVSGDQVFIHILDFPFKSARKSDLMKAVGAELENVLPLDLEDMVYAYERLPQVAVPAVDDAADPGFVAPQQHGSVAAATDGMRVLACAMHRTRARETLDLLEAAGCDARGLVAGPESYPRVMKRLGVDTAPFAVIDVGHARTDVCVIDQGRTVYARTIARGGRDLTHAIARAWGLPFEQAEGAKHQDGFIGTASQPPPTEAWRRIHDALMTQMGPLSRDLRNTLMACRAKVGTQITRAVVVGGGSRVRGTAEFLSERLGVPVTPLSPEDQSKILGGRGAAGADAACLAIGVALEGATGRPVFDLRQGDLAYKADLSILRAKATPLTAFALTIAAFLVLTGFARMKALKSTEKTLNQRLAAETMEIFQKQMTAEEVLAEILPGAGAASVLPKNTAYDLLLQVNEALPGRDKVDIDVREITFKAGKITMDMVSRPKGDLDPTKSISEVEKGLKGVTCFESVARGDTTTESEGAKRVSLTVALKEECR